MVRLAARELRPAPSRHLPLPALIAAGAALLAILVALIWPRTASSPSLPAAPAPTAASATVPPPEPQQPIASLDEALLATTREASLESALGRVAAAWEGARVERTPLRLESPLLRRLDLPAVLELLLPGGQTRHVALVGLAGDGATLDLGSARRRVSWAALESRWTRNAIVLWKDFESLALAPDPGWATRWALDRLRAAGFSGPPGELAAPLARFQAEAGLAADGVLGPRTLMALYSRAGYPRPRLREPGP
jgi:general secretion pathway protein A